MAHVAPSLPTRFPCWCRAVYSWGGESKRDLGFIEGDLIECLNAGDGSWWMGRLRRDKRAMGLFPSNFVQVLDESFTPVSRATTPVVSRNGSEAGSGPSPQKAKTPCRKPFQAYARPVSPPPAASPTALGGRPQDSSTSLNPQLALPQQPPSRPSSSGGHSPYHSRAPSPAPSHQYRPHSQGPSPCHSRASSPAPSHQYRPHSRGPSPYHSRAPSPAPSHQYRPYSRGPSPNPYQDIGSSPPPPAPPPHRTPYNAPPSRATPSPTPSMNDRYPTFSRRQSPAPRSPTLPALTPSPLRDAMEGVMSSLQDMSLRRKAPSPSPARTPSPVDIWSPEAFEELRSKTRYQIHNRPGTAQGIKAFREEDDYRNGNAYDTQHVPSQHFSSDRAPHLGDYVQRMESRLHSMNANGPDPAGELFLPKGNMDAPPAPPPKNSAYQPRPHSALGGDDPISGRPGSGPRLKNRKSAYELGREVIGRTFTTKSSATSSSSGVQSTTTNGTTSTQRTSQSIMSGYSAGGFSATSAGSLARKKGWGSIRGRPTSIMNAQPTEFPNINGRAAFTRPETPLTGISYQSSHGSRPASTVPLEWGSHGAESGGMLGGLTAPKAKKSGFFKKLVESAKTGAASARSSIAVGQAEPPRPPIKSLLPNGVTGIAGGTAARDIGPGAGGSAIDWVQVRRDVNRSNSLSRNERAERADRCQMMDHPVIAPVDVFYEVAEGDEGVDGLPIGEPTNFHAVNLQLVDKNTRFINSLPPMTNPTSLAQGYVCRPYRSDVQRLRAIFTWVSEKVAWEEDFEGEVDSRRVIQMKRGCAEEVAVLVMEMCSSVGMHAEVVRGYLKTPGEVLELGSRPRPNHWWNAVLVDGEWRIMDCSLASPTNPKRALYSSVGSQIAESWWFLARPMEVCYTHIPSILEQQRICPAISPDILLALPCACPPYFKNNLQMLDYDTSLLQLENLELLHIQFTAPSDVECVAEVETRAYARDADGDFFESGDTITKRALAQAEWIDGQKRYVVKALLPGDEGHGTLKVYAGVRGLMHSIKDNPHPLAFALPIVHTGQNPAYDFLFRHPTPHAQRHDLYIAQPQCSRLAVNNTFVFAVRQHPSSSSYTSPDTRSISPIPLGRPASAMSMISSSTSSNPSNAANTVSLHTYHEQQQKPAKLAIQAPSGKILRLTRKSEMMSGGGEAGDGATWETIIKIGERGTWRGLVLADRSARWCVFGEWECV